MKLWFGAIGVLLFACGGKVVDDPAGGTSAQGSSSGAKGDSLDSTASSSPSEKVPWGTSVGGLSGSSGSSGASSSSSSTPGADVGSSGDPIPNDDDPTLAAMCPYRASLIGTYAYAPAFVGDHAGDNVTISRDFTENLYGDGLYRTSFELIFTSPAVKSVDPIHGRTRAERRYTVFVHLVSTVSHPDGFALGAPQQAEVGWGDTEMLTCAEDGSHDDGLNGEELPDDVGNVTITSRTSSRVTGTIDFPHAANGVQRLTFDAPFHHDVAICCLK